MINERSAWSFPQLWEPGLSVIGHSAAKVTAPDRCSYLNQAYLSMFIAGLKRGKGQ